MVHLFVCNLLQVVVEYYTANADSSADSQWEACYETESKSYAAFCFILLLSCEEHEVLL
jgi:hypothetical protein